MRGIPAGSVGKGGGRVDIVILAGIVDDAACASGFLLPLSVVIQIIEIVDYVD